MQRKPETRDLRSKGGRPKTKVLMTQRRPDGARLTKFNRQWTKPVVINCPTAMIPYFRDPATSYLEIGMDDGSKVRYERPTPEDIRTTPEVQA